jgi:hypothetical protein
MEFSIQRSVDVVRTPRVQQLEGMFDVPPSMRSERVWRHRLDLPSHWNIGVIVGPSGSGKTTLAREVFTKQLVDRWPWPQDQSILDGFPAIMGIRDITGLLSSVGFSSPPAWVRPFHALSNGEQFRVNVARTLAEMPELAVVDEFTSVVDRTVVRIGSAAVAKSVRRLQRKFVAVTCHYDVIEYLEPDWIYEPHIAKLTLNQGADGSRGSLWRRPRLNLEIVRTTTAAWELFHAHHYLSAHLHRSAQCYMGLIEDRPAVFTAVLSFPHPNKPGWREHRTVCLPDYQGIGLGNAMSEFIASLYAATGKNYYSTTSHPSMIRHRSRSPNWRLIRRPSFGGRHALWQTAWSRLTASFVYCGPRRPQEARLFGINMRINDTPPLHARLYPGYSQSEMDPEMGGTPAA